MTVASFQLAFHTSFTHGMLTLIENAEVHTPDRIGGGVGGREPRGAHRARRRPGIEPTR